MERNGEITQQMPGTYLSIQYYDETLINFFLLENYTSCNGKT